VKFSSITGWVAYKSSWFKKTSSSSTVSGSIKVGDKIVFKDTINLRSGPGTNYRAVTSSYNGLTGTVLSGPSMNGST